MERRAAQVNRFRRSVAIAGRINQTLERLMPLIPPLSVVMGFLLPGVFIHLRPLITPLFSVITLSGALRLGVGAFGRTLRKPLPILLAFISIHVLMPLIALLVSSLFFRGDADTVAGFILLYSGPTAVSGFIWVSMFRGDPALCLTLILLDTLLAPLVVPGTMLILADARVAIPITAIAVSLLLMVVIPTVIGVTANELSRGKIPALFCPFLAPCSKIFLMLIIAANSSPIAPRVRIDKPGIWAVGAVCVFLAAVSFCVSNLCGAAGRLSGEKRVSLFFAGGLRNISAVTTIAVEFFSEAAALPALLGIVFQQTIAAVMGQLLIGGRKKDAGATNKTV
jgi:tagaturonate reductase